MFTTRPVISKDLLVNPGVGFMDSPNLREPNPQPMDSSRTPVPVYKFRPEYTIVNHPDSILCESKGAHWAEIEPQPGVYDTAKLEQYLEDLAQKGESVLLRFEPYDLTHLDAPQWLHDMFPDDEPIYPFWRIDANNTDYGKYWSRFIREMGKRFDGHPAIQTVDLAIVGAWGEGAGTDFVEDNIFDEIVESYLASWKITPILGLMRGTDANRRIIDTRHNIGLREDCLGDMGGWHGEQWSHMRDLYPQIIANANMEESWKTAPVVFEACWVMDNWRRAGWDIDYIIDESIKWHISAYNCKHSAVPECWKEKVEQWVLKMGYRYELRRFDCEDFVTDTMKFAMLWLNTGCAPIYTDCDLIVRLVGKNDKVFELNCNTDVRTWLPDEDVVLRETLDLTGIPAGKYDVQVGIRAHFHSGFMLNLAIEGRNKDGFYSMGVTEVK